jgi:hypothetical protein
MLDQALRWVRAYVLLSIAILEQQHQAARWTYIGSGMVHERFKTTLETLSPRAAARIAEAAPLFA